VWVCVAGGDVGGPHGHTHTHTTSRRYVHLILIYVIADD
jgi:hypothetical protein